MTKDEIRNKLRNTLEQRGLKMRSVSMRAGLGTNGLRNILTGRTQKLDMDDVKKVLDVIHISLQDFVARENFMDPPARDEAIPLYGEIPAGNSLFTEDANPTDHIPSAGLSSKNHFAVRVHGESMSPHYQDGDVVICEKAEGISMPVKEDGPTPIEKFQRYIGRVVAVVIDNNETTLKRLEAEGRGEHYTLVLRPLNPDYPTKIIGANVSFLIQGEVVKLIRDI